MKNRNELVPGTLYCHLGDRSTEDAHEPPMALSLLGNRSSTEG